MSMSLDNLILALQELKESNGSWVGAIEAVDPKQFDSTRTQVVIDLYRDKVWVNMDPNRHLRP